MDADRRFDVVVVGSANTDFIVFGDRLPSADEPMQAESFAIGCGGKGLNQAVGVSRMGASVAFVARVGRDRRGRRLIMAAEDAGIDVTHVAVDDDASSGAALISVDAQGRKQISFMPGANARLTVDDVLRSRHRIAHARVVLVQLEVPLECVEAAVRIAADAGTIVVLDPAPGRRLHPGLLRMVDVIRPNTSEARALTGVNVAERYSALAAGRVLLDLGVGTAIVDAKADGNVVVWNGGMELLPHFTLRAVDSTGAGDAFMAALAAQLAEGAPLLDAAEIGNAAAALKSTRSGAHAGLPFRHEVLELRARGPNALARDDERPNEHLALRAID